MSNYNYNQDFKGSVREKKLERYTRDSFTKELIGNPIKIGLSNGKEISGRLIELGMFDIKVQTPNGRLIVLKSGILTVEVMA